MPTSRRNALKVLLAAPLAIAGCVADRSIQPDATNTSAPELTPTNTAIPTEVPPTGTATAVPTATPAPNLVELRPAQIPQGGTATVILNAAAVSGAFTFQGRQYPVASSGGRRWAVIGCGAFTTPATVPIGVSYTLPGAASTSASGSLVIVDAGFPVEEITLDPTTAELLAPNIIQAELNQRAAIYGNYTPDRLWTGPFIRPATADIGDTYGMARSYNGAPATDYHRGTDFTGHQGDPVIAAADGNVVFAGELKVRGNSVIVDHGLGVFTAYHHFSRIDIAQGASVRAGQQVGLIGATGLVTGPHLHWEVIVRGIEVDGRAWLQGTDFGL
jgi:murein DD-endopeptidase MepM/ murein hydrolase activator NlpD